MLASGVSQRKAALKLRSKLNALRSKICRIQAHDKDQTCGASTGRKGSKTLKLKGENWRRKLPRSIVANSSGPPL
jgi:hypothetical protein